MTRYIAVGWESGRAVQLGEVKAFSDAEAIGRAVLGFGAAGRLVMVAAEDGVEVRFLPVQYYLYLFLSEFKRHLWPAVSSEFHGRGVRAAFAQTPGGRLYRIPVMDLQRLSMDETGPYLNLPGLSEPLVSSPPVPAALLQWQFVAADLEARAAHS